MYGETACRMQFGFTKRKPQAFGNGQMTHVYLSLFHIKNQEII
jgi:hypothetical protein